LGGQEYRESRADILRPIQVIRFIGHRLWFSARLLGPLRSGRTVRPTPEIRTDFPQYRITSPAPDVELVGVGELPVLLLWHPVPVHPGRGRLLDLLTAGEHAALFVASLPAAGPRRPRQAVSCSPHSACPPPTTRWHVICLAGTGRLSLALTLPGQPRRLLDEPYRGFDHGSYLDSGAMLRPGEPTAFLSIGRRHSSLSGFLAGGSGQAAQHDSLDTSRLKAWATSRRPSDIVR
jgi:hypothetical protein